MKKLFIMCAAIAALYSCSESPELEKPTEELSGKKLTATISMPTQESKHGSRISSDLGAADQSTWKFSWQGYERPVMIFHDENGAIDGLILDNLAFEGEKATFNGTIPAKAANATHYSIIFAANYQGALVDMIFNYNMDFEMSFSRQYIYKQNDEMRGIIMVCPKTALPEADADGNVVINPTLKHLNAFLHLKISCPTIDDTEWRDISIDEITIDGVISKAKVRSKSDLSVDYDASTLYNKIPTPITPYFGEDRYPLSAEDTKFPITVIPTELAAGEQISVTVHLSNGKQYEYKTPAFDRDITLERANVYPINIEIDPLSDNLK